MEPTDSPAAATPAQTRDNFSKAVRDRVAGEVGYRCSNPDCGAPTIGPGDETDRGVSNLGVAAHITAAAPGGPRYDGSLTPEQRRHYDNALWLCQRHAKAVDDNVSMFTVAQLREWKTTAIDLARRALLSGDIDPNGQLRLKRSERNSVAKSVLFAAIDARIAMLRGVELAGSTKALGRNGTLSNQTIMASVKSWLDRCGAAYDALHDALRELKVHWRAPDPNVTDSIVKLIVWLGGWNNTFKEELASEFGTSFGLKTPSQGTGWNWSLVYKGNKEHKDMLLAALDAEIGVIERWADEHVASRQGT